MRGDDTYRYRLEVFWINHGRVHVQEYPQLDLPTAKRALNKSKANGSDTAYVQLINEVGHVVDSRGSRIVAMLWQMQIPRP